MTHTKQTEGNQALRWIPIYIVAAFIAFTTFVGVVFIGVMVAISGSNEIIVSLVQVGIAIICSLLGGWIIGNRVSYRGALHGMLSAMVADVVLVTIMLIGMLNAGVSAIWIILSVVGVLLLSPALGALGGFWGERSLCRKK